MIIHQYPEQEPIIAKGLDIITLNQDLYPALKLGNRSGNMN